MLWSSIIMDEASLFDLLVNSSPLAGFAIYLVTQNKSMSKKVDEINDKSEARSEALTTRFEERELALRDRYDKVITNLQVEKESIKDESQATITLLSNKLDALERHIQDVDKKFDQILNQLQNLTNTVQELRIKDIARDTKGK
tara:strand:+ start:1414 stop:1842 length:429 start_codon:yes stop_codon:yes gene_type:complete